VYPYFDGKLWGLTNEAAEELLAPQIQKNFRFYMDQSAFVQVNGKWGILDPSGTFRAKPQYDRLEDLSDVYGYATIGKKKSAINLKTGKESGKTFDDVTDFCYCKEGIFVVKTGAKYGLLDAGSDKLVVKAIYDKVKVSPNNRSKAFVTVGKKTGLLDIFSGKLNLPISFDALEDESLFVGNLIESVYKGTKGKVTKLYTPEGVEVTGESDDTATIEMVQEDRGGYDDQGGESLHIYPLMKGQWKITYEKRGYGSTEVVDSYTVSGYDAIEKLTGFYYPGTGRHDYIKVIKNGKMGIIEPSGKVVLEPVYGLFLTKDNEGLITIVDGNQGLYTKNMELVIKPVLKEVIEYDNSREGWLVELPDGRKGYLKATGKLLIPGYTN
jgi:hypothetical protein